MRYTLRANQGASPDKARSRLFRQKRYAKPEVNIGGVASRLARGFFAVSQIIVGRAGIESAHRSTKATRLAMGARLVWESRAAAASVSFRASNHEPSIMKPEASGYGVAWRSAAQSEARRGSATCHGPPADFSSLHRRRPSPPPLSF